MSNSHFLKQLIQRPFRSLGFQIVRYRRDDFWKYEWLRKIRISTILDVGANEGQFASEMSQLFPQAHIYSFEPLKGCYERLQVVLKNNPRFIGYNVAISDREGNDVMFRNEFSPSSSLLEMTDVHRQAFPYTQTQTKESIRLARLDGLCGDIPFESPVLLKIDVQGSEMQVLRGGEKVLKSVHVAIVETSFQNLYEGQASFNDVFDFLKNRGFTFKGFLDQLFSPMDGSVLQGDAIFIQSNPPVPNRG